MNASHICSACRQNIPLVLRRNGVQSRSKSGFVSLLNPRTSADDSSARHSPAIENVGPSRGRKEKRRDVVPPRAVPKPSRIGRADLLETLFEEGRATSPTSIASVTSTAVLEKYEHFETFQKLLSRDVEPIGAVWQYFVTNLGPQCWASEAQSIYRPVAFKVVACKLLEKLKKARQKSQSLAELPTVTDIVSTYSALNMLQLVDWHFLVSDLLCRLSEQAQKRDRIDLENASFDSLPSDLSNDLLGAWRVLCRQYGSSSTRQYTIDDSDPSDWSFLPSLREQLRNASSAALATFSLLTDDAFAERLHGVRSHPFIKATAEALANSSLSSENMLMFPSQSVRNHLIKIKIDRSGVLQRAREIARDPRAPRTEMQYPAVQRLGFSSTLTYQRLAGALAKRDLRLIDKLWVEASQSSRDAQPKQQYESNEDVSASADIKPSVIIKRNADRLSQELCNQFIRAYMGMRQPNRAVDIWNCMLERSLPPTMSTWNAMLEGCKVARNIQSLEEVWKKLLDSGTKPDMRCWTTRISCLVECGKPEQAVRALEKMGSTWSEAAKKNKIKDPRNAGDVDGTAKPTIETVNAAISGLLRRKRIDAATRVLAWGSAFGIQPDVITFNTLLRALIREGRTESVPALLGQMQQLGVRADVATFTTIIDETFKNFDPQTSEERTQLINQIFTEMEEANVIANQHTYNRLINSLLESPSKDMAAVNLVLARMVSKGVEPSPHIYTMIISHYFAQDPPDLEAVRFLVERIGLTGIIMDHIFWDRVIEGYARVGDTSTALTILGRVDKESAWVGWPALQMVLVALARNGEWDLARQVVRNVMADRGGPPNVHEKGVEGQHAFWMTVADFKLMDG